MTEEKRYFDTYIQIAWPARIVAPGLAVHHIPRTRKTYALTHGATGLRVADSTNLNVLVQLASELAKRCENLSHNNQKYIQKTIPESLTLYIGYVRKGGTQTYLTFCKDNRITPAPILREQIELSDILSSDL